MQECEFKAMLKYKIGFFSKKSIIRNVFIMIDGRLFAYKGQASHFKVHKEKRPT